MSRSALQGYLGIGRQAAKGTAVPPTNFVKLTGKPSTAPVINLNSNQEGPGRDLSLVTKQSQTFDGSFGFLARPRTAGLILANALGVSRLTGAAKAGGANTTLSAPTIAGATEITVASAANIAVDKIVQVDVNAAATVAEVRKVTGINGSTVTVSPALEFAHAGGVAVAEVEAPYTHVLTPTADYDLPWLTIETAIADLIQRIQDCRLDGVTFSGKAGAALELAVDYVGLTAAAQEAETAQTYEPDNPFMFHAGTFTIDTVGATNISDFSLGLKNGIGRDDFTVDVVRADAPVGKRDLEASFTLEPDDATRAKALYFGAADLPGKEPVTGSLVLDFGYGVGTAARGLKVEVPSLFYVAEPLEHDPAGGRLTTAVRAIATKAAGSELMTVTIKTDSYLRM